METTQTTEPRKAKAPSRIPLPKTSRHLNNLLEWYANPTAKSLKHIHQHYSRDAFYKDPLTEVYTANEIQSYFDRLFGKITDMHFVFENIVEEHHQAFVTWVMTARFMGREFSVQGSSHFKFDTSGLCEYQRDYFDLSAEVYEHIPLLGYLFKGLKRVLN